MYSLLHECDTGRRCGSGKAMHVQCACIKKLWLHLVKDLAVGPKLLQGIMSNNFKGNFNFGDSQFWFLAAGYTTGIAQASVFSVFLKLGYFIIWVKYFINERQTHLFTQLLGIINTSGWQILWNNSFVHCEDLCCCDWFNKEADWPIVEQDKVRWEGQTENAWRKKGRVSSQQKTQGEAGWACCAEEGTKARGTV